MSVTYLYLHLPESEPTSTRWSKSNAELLQPSMLHEFLHSLGKSITSIKDENFAGKYDSKNLENFLSAPEILDDLYPRPIRKVLRTLLKDSFDDWRFLANNLYGKQFSIYGEYITDHTVCKIAEHSSLCKQRENFLLFNYHALTLKGTIPVVIDNIKREIISVQNIKELVSWFSENRVPKRSFHATNKHRANNGGNWKNASSLNCSVEHAQALLNSAIGDSNTLYNFDETNQSWLKFMFDNTSGPDFEKLYHGYHLHIDTPEVPDKIKKQLKN